MTALTSTNTHSVQEMCRHFTRATGWPLLFVNGDGELTAETESLLRDDPSCCWFSHVRLEDATRGFLTMGLPPNTSHDGTFNSACDLAEQLSNLLNRFGTAARSLDVRSYDLSKLIDLGNSRPSQENIADILTRLLGALLQLTSFQSTAFFLLDSAANEVNLRAKHQTLEMSIPHPSRDLRLSPPDLEALANGDVLLQRNRGRDEEFLPDEAGVGVGVRVRNDSGPLGTLWAFDRRNRVPARDEVQVLASAAAQLGQLLGRLVLHQDSDDGRRIHRELQVVADGEDYIPVLPVDGDTRFEVARHCSSRFEVGGDLCELVPINPHKTVIVVGDASGDSIPAALIMNSVRGCVRSLIDVYRDNIEQTDSLMARVNKTLHDVTPPHQFMSLFIGVLDTEAMTLTYTNAGHPCPVVVRDLGFAALESHGVLVGVTTEASYTKSVVSLVRGNALVLFSDGVTEAMNSNREMFRYDGIISAIKDSTGKSAKDLKRDILIRLEQHLEGSNSGDDRTLLVIRMMG
ncbi:MAG: PP2C family protein-serine/threonine phosphatase [Planctomycetota bacterium]|nr:PP2C family protein-serine/threonine phosphatase [Planctomycetota bacterium]